MKTSTLVWQNTQHQDLLALVESLKNSPEVGVEILDKLTDYVTHHFSLEETYMKATNFSNSELHIRAHRNFENKINEMKRNPRILQNGFRDDVFRHEITDYLNEWLINHVLAMDKVLEAHILNSGVK